MSEQSLAGKYQSQNNTASTLILHSDKTFEFAVVGEKATAVFIPDTTTLNFYSTGQWQLQKNNKLILQASHPIASENKINDSVTHFTNISAIHFWNRYGEPISIRSISIAKGKAKPHFGNGLYFFSQDFKNTDTLVFNFEGYSSISYPGDIPYTFGNNMHKVTLTEDTLLNFASTDFTIKSNSLVAEDNQLLFKKKK